MVHENIKLFRVHSKLTQVEFAKRLGVSQVTISSWENSITTPDINHVLTMVEMGANINFLLHGVGSPLQRMSA